MCALTGHQFSLFGCKAKAKKRTAIIRRSADPVYQASAATTGTATRGQDRILRSKAACSDPLTHSFMAVLLSHTSTGLFGAANVLVEMEDVLRVVALRISISRA